MVDGWVLSCGPALLVHGLAWLRVRVRVRVRALLEGSIVEGARLSLIHI